MILNLSRISEIAKKNKLSMVYLFGSKALNIDSELSDIDIAVLLDNKNKYDLRKLLLDLIFDFSQLFHNDKIDILILNNASLSIQYNVICEGKILYQLNDNIKCNYETKIIKLYLDFKKYEIEYYKIMHQKYLQID